MITLTELIGIAVATCEATEAIAWVKFEFVALAKI